MKPAKAGFCFLNGTVYNHSFPSWLAAAHPGEILATHVYIIPTGTGDPVVGVGSRRGTLLLCEHSTRKFNLHGGLFSILELADTLCASFPRAQKRGNFRKKRSKTRRFFVEKVAEFVRVDRHLIAVESPWCRVACRVKWCGLALVLVLQIGVAVGSAGPRWSNRTAPTLALLL